LLISSAQSSWDVSELSSGNPPAAFTVTNW
jgi:hypothetical protein